MNEYSGRTCPYCKAMIESFHYIHVCSDCGMPHHQECWMKNGGCTTTGCQGTIQDVPQSEPIAAEPVFMQPSEEQLICLKCAAKNPFSNQFCSKCGARLLKPLGTKGTSPGPSVENATGKVSHPGTPPSFKPIGRAAPENLPAVQPIGRSSEQPPKPMDLPAEPQGWTKPQNKASVDYQGFRQSTVYSLNNTQPLVSEEDFIGKNTEYYRRVFMVMRRENKKACWNWSAWYLNVFWCFYRKMYKIGFIFLGFQLIAFLLPDIQLVLNLLTTVVMGFFGNYFYLRYTEEAIKRAEGVPDLMRYAYLRKKGGTSPGAVAILVGSAVIVGFIIGFVSAFFSYME